jgi:hypothetical protein
MTRHHLSRSPVYRDAKRQRGSIAVMSAGVLLLILAMCGFALDLGQMYNRKVEMQNVADTLALAAARELNGTDAGIREAVRQASLRLTEQHERLTYQYSKLPLELSERALQFSASPDDGWRDATSAAADAANILYVRVNTADLSAAYGEVNTLLIHVVYPSSVVSTRATAVAGRSSINVAPLAVCALRPTAREAHSGELVEYGFRRGLAYDLMKLTPATSSPSTFLINPFANPGAPGASAVSDLSLVRPFVCTGTMPLTRVTGGTLTVGAPFPLGTLVDQLNSRFDSFVAPCEATSAPPDANVKEYVYNTATAGDRWMNQQPTLQTVDPSVFADPLVTPAGTTNDKHGQVWAFAQAVRYSASVPSNGESVFATTDWPTLYSGAAKKATGYPSSGMPYDAYSGSTFRAPPSARKGVRGRRVLNVPLLSCPVSGSRATVLGIGKFFMPVRASGTSLPAEFAGVVSEASVGGKVGLY